MISCTNTTSFRALPLWFFDGFCPWPAMSRRWIFTQVNPAALFVSILDFRADFWPFSCSSFWFSLFGSVVTFGFISGIYFLVFPVIWIPGRLVRPTVWNVFNLNLLYFYAGSKFRGFLPSRLFVLYLLHFLRPTTAGRIGVNILLGKFIFVIWIWSGRDLFLWDGDQLLFHRSVQRTA